MDAIFFYIFGILTLAGAIIVVIHPSPIASALALVLSFFGMAAIFVMLQAPFVAVMQVLLYAGAIMVLFIFVIMLLNLAKKSIRFRTIAGSRLILAAAALYLGALLLLLIQCVPVSTDEGAKAAGDGALIGTIDAVGEMLLSKYIIPFEFTSLVLLIAVVGAVYLSRKRFSA